MSNIGILVFYNHRDFPKYMPHKDPFKANHTNTNHTQYHFNFISLPSEQHEELFLCSFLRLVLIYRTIFAVGYRDDK